MSISSSCFSPLGGVTIIGISREARIPLGSLDEGETKIRSWKGRGDREVREEGEGKGEKLEREGKGGEGKGHTFPLG